MQVVRAVGEACPEVVEVAPEPAAADADFVRRIGEAGIGRGRPLGVRAGAIVAIQRAVHQQRREIHPGIDRQLQRAPQAAVELDERMPARGAVHLALDHGDALPVKGGEERVRLRPQLRWHRDALAVDADAAGGWFFTQPAMREGRP